MERVEIEKFKPDEFGGERGQGIPILWGWSDHCKACDWRGHAPYRKEYSYSADDYRRDDYAPREVEPWNYPNGQGETD